MGTYRPFFPFRCRHCSPGASYVAWHEPVEERNITDPWPVSNCWVCGRFGEHGHCCGVTNKFVHTFD